MRADKRLKVGRQDNELLGEHEHVECMTVAFMCFVTVAWCAFLVLDWLGASAHNRTMLTFIWAES